MPEGPLGAPRLSNIGPLSRSTEKELRRAWMSCPEGGKEKDICVKTKEVAMLILQGQGFFAECQDLEDINSGSCHKVSEQVFSLLDDTTGVSIMNAGDGDHSWLRYNGKHYDAERPSGVDHYENLPFFKSFPTQDLLVSAEMAGIIDDARESTLDDVVRDVTGEKV